jgi:hypothetical protein
VPDLRGHGDSARPHDGTIEPGSPQARFARYLTEVPGDHASALASPQLVTAIVEFLTG